MLHLVSIVKMAVRGTNVRSEVCDARCFCLESLIIIIIIIIVIVVIIIIIMHHASCVISRVSCVMCHV